MGCTRRRSRRDWPLKVTPQAFSLRVQWPGGGTVWNHPASFTVENVENAGATQRVPIVDVLWMARLALLALLGLWLLGLTVSARLSKKENAS